MKTHEERGKGMSAVVKSSRRMSKKNKKGGRKPGSLTQGTININARDYENAFIHQSNGGHDINIQGVKDRNGALHGDEVLVCNKSREEWTVFHHRIREYLETEGDPQYRMLLKGAKMPNGQSFNFQSSDDEVNEEDKASKPHHLPPNIRKKKNVKKGNDKAKALHDAVFNDKDWGQTPVHNDKEWVVDDLPTPVANSSISRNIPILSFENNAPPVSKEEIVKKPIEILTPDALNSAIPDPEYGIKLPENIPVVTTFTKPIVPSVTSSNGFKPAVSIISLEALKKEVAIIECKDSSGTAGLKESSGLENHDTEGEESKNSRSKKQKRRRKRNSKSCAEKNQNQNSKPSKVLKLPEDLVFDVESVLKHKLSSNFLQKTGYVIKIIKKNHSRLAVGHLKPFAIKNSDYIIFSPLDTRVPRMKIPISQAPSDFALKPQFYATTLFVAKIKEWNASKFALGTLVESIGESSSVEVQTKGTLIANGIDEAPFSEEVLQCLPQLPFTIPQEEYSKRRDFTQECVFTIDPLTARDLDDALSIEPAGEGKYRVGVHIADVSYFVTKDTALDKCASDRATSVYLTDRVIPMLPRELCENLCSLNPDVPRLTFSVEWIVTEDGEVESTWFGRSIIKSAIKLAYEHAQDMLDNPDKKWTSDELPPLSSPWTYSDISSKVSYLQKIALKLRNKRKENGSLRLDVPKICFSLNRETGMPTAFHLYEHRHSNKLIEEFMLLANISVATKIHSHLPQLAVLRCHPPPKKNMMDNLTKTLKRHNYTIDPTSSKSIADSLEEYSKCTDPLSVKKYQVLVTLLTKPMELALYFCAGSVSDTGSYRHFALNIPLYTHFTSPIRRYPDIIVHRLLDAILEDKSLDWNSSTIHKIASHCNKKRLDARNVSQDSQQIFLTQFVTSCGPVENLDAIVLEVKNYSIEMLIIDMALVQRVYLNYLDTLESYEFSSSRGINRMVLKWKPDEQNKNTSISVITAFSEIKCTLKEQDGSNKLNTIIVRPLLPEKM